MSRNRAQPGPAHPAMIRASVLSLICDGLKSRDLPVERLLERHLGISNALADPYAQLELHRYVALFEGAAALARDPFFGLRLADEIELEQFGPLGIVILAAANLGEALGVWERYAATWQSGTMTNVVLLEDQVECAYQISDRSIRQRRQDSEFSLALTCRLFRGLVGRQWTPMEVHFEHAAPPGYDTAAARRLYHHAFRCPVEFGAPTNKIVISPADLTIPSQGAYHLLAPFVVPMLQTLGSVDPATVSARVAQLIGQKLGREEVSIAAIASALGLSRRTLQRRLESEGTSLRAIARQCRQGLAETMLADPARQVTSIALSLGYADSAVLSRAFKSWTGEPPRTYRGAILSRH